jgi:hypothetical protein
MTVFLTEQPVLMSLTVTLRNRNPRMAQTAQADEWLVTNEPQLAE